MKKLHRFGSTTRWGRKILSNNNIKEFAYHPPRGMDSATRWYSTAVQEDKKIVNAKQKEESIVVLGGGWGSYSLMNAFKDLGDYSDDTQLYCLTRRDHFLFTPLLAQASVGTIDFRSCTEPIRLVRSEQNFNYLPSQVRSIDTDEQLVELEPIHEHDSENYFIHYDKLVIGLGCDVNTMNVKGAEEYGFFMKELDNARRIRRHIIDLFERASNPAMSVQERKALLTICVIGSGPTGIETAAEITDFVKQDLSKLYQNIIQDYQLIILEAGNQILGMFDQSIQRYAQRRFKKDNVQIYTNTPVKELQESSVILQDGSKIDCGMAIWSPGIQPRKMVKDNTPTLPKDPHGRILVDDHLRVQGFDNVWAIGDCCYLESNPLPATAQVASQQGKYVAGELQRMLKEEHKTGEDAQKKEESKPFKFLSRGIMAYIGNYRAVTQVSDEKGNKLRIKGLSSWILWRSAYLTMLVSVRNKVLIWMDWFRSFWFGRGTMK